MVDGQKTRERTVVFASALTFSLLALLSWLTVDVDLIVAINRSDLTQDSKGLIQELHTWLPRRFIALATAVGFIVWARARNRGLQRLAATLVVATVLTNLATRFIKLVVDRPRPPLELLDIQTLVGFNPESGAFPSAHTSTAAATLFGLFFLCAKSKKRRFFFLLPLPLIAWGRVAAGVHYPSDVLGSFALALGVHWLLMGDRVDGLLLRPQSKILVTTCGATSLGLVFWCLS